MSDTIYRQDAIDALNKHIDTFDAIDTNYLCGLRTAMSILKEMPSAQPERKMGRWINAYPDIEPNPMFMYGICSVCGFEQAISNKLNFCPNCGARMEGESDE